MAYLAEYKKYKKYEKQKKMEQTLMTVFDSGLTPELAWTLLKMLIVLLVVLSVRNWMGNLVARRLAYGRLRKNKYLKAGAWVDWPTTTGSIQAKVDRITPDKVVLRAREKGLWVHVPIMQFAESALTLIDIKPACRQGARDHE